MRLRVGFTGGGGITETHACAARDCPDLEIAAFCGTNPEKVAALVDEHGGQGFTRIEEMLAGVGLDFVVIGSPSGLHVEQGLAAVAQGVHVLVEKPMDVSTERADALIAAAKRANVRLGVLFQDRLKPGLARLKDAVEDGVLGRPLLASARVKWHRPPEYYVDSRWRGTLALDGGAALINQGIHTVDLLLWLLGEVASVRSLTATSFHPIEGEDIALALLEFRSGAVATLEATTCAFPGYPRRVEITGTKGTVAVEGDDVVAAELRTPRPELVASSRTASSGASSPRLAGADDHRRVLEDFARAIRDGAPPVCNGHEGRRSLAVVEAVYAAAKAGGREVT
ncbi:MAG: Gfo/Idh/MocA family oxidoreductase [Acidobacteriota bacterium]|jgi:predicted dehydrogenase